MIILGTEEQKGRFKDSPGPGEAFVVFDSRGESIVLTTGQRLSPGETRFWGTRKVVRINAAEQPTTVETLVTGADGYSEFKLVLTATWKVTDFRRAATDGTTDITALVRTAVESRASQFDRKFEITKDGADRLYEELCTDLQFQVVDFVTLARVSGRVVLPETTTSHLSKVQKVKQDSELDRVRLGGEKETEALKLELEKMRQEHGREMARAQANNELAILNERLKVYAEVTKDPGSLISLQLANDPSQVNIIVKDMRNEQITRARLHLDAVKAMVDADAVEGFQLEEVAKRSLHAFLQLAGNTSELPADETLQLPNNEASDDKESAPKDSTVDAVKVERVEER